MGRLVDSLVTKTIHFELYLMFSVGKSTNNRTAFSELNSPLDTLLTLHLSFKLHPSSFLIPQMH